MKKEPSPRNPRCNICGELTTRLDYLDAYACRDCDIWHSRPCTDKDGVCDYCDELRKTERPSYVPKYEWDNPWNT